MSASRFIYRLFLTALGPALLLLFFWQGKKNGVKHHAKQRLGFIPKRPDNVPRPFWFHAASVGEVNGLAPLLKVFKAKHPSLPILLTTTTISGYRNAQQQLPDVPLHFFPFDFSHSVQRFLERIQPQQLFVMETEIWPTLFRKCDQRNIGINIISGRLSKKTLSSPAWVRQLYRDALGRVSAIAARTEEERDAFITLGAPATKCQSLGNIKYAASLSIEKQRPLPASISLP